MPTRGRCLLARGRLAERSDDATRRELLQHAVVIGRNAGEDLAENPDLEVLRGMPGDPALR